MKYYLTKEEDVLKELNTASDGISETESKQRESVYGKNKLQEAKKVSIAKRFLKQLADPMIIILIVAAIISAVTASIEGEGEGYADVIIIMIVVLINAVLGVVQESKAEAAIAALQKMSAATSKVLRNGTITIIKSEDLVPGDVVILEAGDAVPADGRIIESASLKIEEAALTGESVPVNKYSNIIEVSDSSKDVPLGDRKNMMYMGSTVVYGRGKAVVTDIGMNTEMGKIANALTLAEEGKTPLQIKLSQLSKALTWIVLGICVFIFAFNIIKAGDFHFEPIMNSFMAAVSLAVAAIPEGLATVVTIVLSIGVTKMSKRNAIIRKLTAVETLGCAQIICSDKTGTLTQNKMTVVEHFGDDEQLLAKAMALCSDAELDPETNEATGEPTECALVNYAYSKELSKPELKTEYPRVSEIPFDSMRKMMSTFHSCDNEIEKCKIIQFTKGAPDEILKRCTSYISDGKIYEMTDEYRNIIIDANKSMADKALRVLCASMRFYDELPCEQASETAEKDLIFIGLTGMIDPIRPEVKDAIAECKSAGIRAVMITGDHKDTAVAIAKQLGIIDDVSQAITGAELNDISDEELDKRIKEFGVYARVQPEHKVRIVNAWRKNGYITAMTGDGVNDAPSIKNADIGIGMGITGTDVTKNVADMVLADDNFATIVGAVGEGRRIYDNIRKAIQFLLGSNMSEVLSVFFSSIFGFVILKPVHLLWINLITDCFPALALGIEKGEKDLMKRKPRDSKDGIFAGGLGIDVIYQGVLVSALTVFAFLIGNYFENGIWSLFNASSSHGITMAFLTMSMAEIFHSFNMRSQRGSIFAIKGQNMLLWGACVLSIVLTSAVIEIPFLASAFDFTRLGIKEYGISLALALAVIPIVELVKLIQRAISRK